MLLWVLCVASTPIQVESLDTKGKMHIYLFKTNCKFKIKVVFCFVLIKSGCLKGSFYFRGRNRFKRPNKEGESKASQP